ncbi:hypothetical protein Ct9H90mP29_12380 [bacterium]|nr:MAG: hypothetical protein Ct9H90mP29_12380 [bacterium]
MDIELPGITFDQRIDGVSSMGIYLPGTAKLCTLVTLPELRFFHQLLLIVLSVL